MSLVLTVPLRWVSALAFALPLRIRSDPIFFVLDHSTRQHIRDALNRCVAGHTDLVKKHNALQHKLAKLPKPHPNSIVPPPIDLDTVSKLDVDSDIWMDIGLDDPDEFGGTIPDWLGDDHTRSGIRAMHDVENCQAELDRCYQERTTLQTWFTEEHAATARAAECASGKFSVFSLMLHNQD